MRRPQGAPPLQAQQSCNFEDFTDIVSRLLNGAWGEDWGTFSEAFPNGRDAKSLKLPIITYTLKEMVPGVIGKEGTREIKPRHRHTFPQEVHGGSATEVYGQVLDCQVLFEIWEENNAKASALADKLRALLFMYTGFIKSQGVKELFFQRYANETEANKFRDSIVGRSLYYGVRLEDLIHIDTEVIERVVLNIIATDIGPFVKNGQTNEDE